MSQDQRIVIASSNVGKLKELRTLLSSLPLTLVPQSDFNIEDADETGRSFVENAIIKARHAAEWSGLPSIADDSGIEVDVLDGKPGVHSARYAGEGATDEDNLRLLLANLQPFAGTKIDARFQCVMVFLRHADDASPLIAQSSWEGYIVPEPRGTAGFGYDPIFYVPGHNCTSAELPPDVKNTISHRGQASRLLLGLLSGMLD